MPQTQSGTLSFPPFYGKVRALILINALVYFAVLAVLPQPGEFTQGRLLGIRADADRVFAHGYLWQLITYSFLHASISHILFNMWRSGCSVQPSNSTSAAGDFWSFISSRGGAALVTVLLTFSAGGFLGLRPEITHGWRFRRNLRCAAGLRIPVP